MATRYVCANCGMVQRASRPCKFCRFQTSPVNTPASASEVLMWVLTAIGLVLLLATFAGFPLGIFLAISFFVAAVVFNVIADSQADKRGEEMAVGLARNAVRCPRCRGALVFEPSIGRPLCPSCRTAF